MFSTFRGRHGDGATGRACRTAPRPHVGGYERGFNISHFGLQSAVGIRGALAGASRVSLQNSKNS